MRGTQRSILVRTYYVHTMWTWREACWRLREIIAMSWHFRVLGLGKFESSPVSVCMYDYAVRSLRVRRAVYSVRVLVCTYISWRRTDLRSIFSLFLSLQSSPPFHLFQPFQCPVLVFIPTRLRSSALRAWSSGMDSLCGVPNPSAYHWIVGWKHP